MKHIRRHTCLRRIQRLRAAHQFTYEYWTVYGVRLTARDALAFWDGTCYRAYRFVNGPRRFWKERAR